MLACEMRMIILNYFSVTGTLTINDIGLMDLVANVPLYPDLSSPSVVAESNLINN